LSNSCARTTLRPSKGKHTTCVTSPTTRFAVPVANRYAPLSNHYEQQAFNDRISLTTSEQPSELPSISNCKSVKGSRRNKTFPESQPSLPGNYQPTKLNLQTPKKNEDGSYSIPNIVNGETSVNVNAESDHKRRDSIVNNINELRQSINLCNKDVHALSKKHKSASHW
jgi:hypothetical protein